MEFKLKLSRTQESGSSHNSNMTIIVDAEDEAAARRHYDETSDRMIKKYELIGIESGESVKG